MISFTSFISTACDMELTSGKNDPEQSIKVKKKNSHLLKQLSGAVAHELQIYVVKSTENHQPLQKLHYLLLVILQSRMVMTGIF